MTIDLYHALWSSVSMARADSDASSGSARAEMDRNNYICKKSIQKQAYKKTRKNISHQRKFCKEYWKKKSGKIHRNRRIWLLDKKKLMLACASKYKPWAAFHQKASNKILTQSGIVQASMQLEPCSWQDLETHGKKCCKTLYVKEL